MNDDRWVELSKLYRKMHQSFRDDHLRATLLTRSLRLALIKTLGCDPDNVDLFEYDETTHTYEPEKSPSRAVSMNGDYIWFAGFGVTLEVAPNAYPKTSFQFPVWFNLNGNPPEVDTSFGKFPILPADNPDFDEACEAIYVGLKSSVINRTNRKAANKKFGFLDFEE